MLLASWMGMLITRALFRESVWGIPSMSKSVVSFSLPDRGIPLIRIDSNGLTVR